MIFRAINIDTTKLLSLPESGMGYQVIQDTRPNNMAKYLVFNAELILPMDGTLSQNIQAIRQRGYDQLLRNAINFSVPTNNYKLLTGLEYRTGILNLTDSLINYKQRHRYGTAAKDNPSEKANGQEVFVRVSAYKNDKRIDFINRKLLPGTYTTTLSDYIICVNTNDNPIDRYALPSDEEIRWAFYIQPKSWDYLKRGVVQPAFGHHGGGLEALFESGTSVGTYLHTTAYGK